MENAGLRLLAASGLLLIFLQHASYAFPVNTSSTASDLSSPSEERMDNDDLILMPKPKKVDAIPSGGISPQDIRITPGNVAFQKWDYTEDLTIDLGTMVARFAECIANGDGNKESCTKGSVRPLEDGKGGKGPPGEVGFRIVDLQGIYDFAKFVEGELRAAGYIFAQVIVPPQSIHMPPDGSAPADEPWTIKFQVVVGTITDIIVCDSKDATCAKRGPATGGKDSKESGDSSAVFSLVRRILDPLYKKPANIKHIESWILLAEDIPGVSVRPILRPSPDQPGGIDMHVQVTHHIWSADVMVDNRGSQYAGPWQSQASARLNSLLSDAGDQIEATLFKTFPNRQHFEQLSAGTYIGNYGLRWRATVGYGDSIPGGMLQLLGYRSKTLVGGGRLEMPVVRQRYHALVLQPEFQVSQTRSDVADPSNSGGRIHQSDANIRALRFTAGYKGWWFPPSGVFGDEAAFPVPIGVRALGGVHRGLSILGATTSESVYSPRPGADGVFTKYTLDVDVEPRLYQISKDLRINAKLSFSGQVTNDILLPTEKFYAGGQLRGRGYYYGQITGDSGYFIGGELNIESLFDATDDDRPGKIYPSTFQVYGFYNAARTFDLGDFDVPKRYIASVGGGVRLLLDNIAELEGEIAHRLKLNPLGDADQALKPWAAYTRLVLHF